MFYIHSVACLVRPTINVVPQKLAEEGETFEVPCTYDGQNVTNVYWEHDGVAFQSMKVQTSTTVTNVLSDCHLSFTRMFNRCLAGSSRRSAYSSLCRARSGRRDFDAPCPRHSTGRYGRLRLLRDECRWHRTPRNGNSRAT